MKIVWGGRRWGVASAWLGVAIACCPSAAVETVSFYDGSVLVRTAPPGQWQWHPLAVGAGGQNCGLAFDPTNPQRIYLRIDVAGVIKTEDAGEHWRNSNAGLHGLSQGQYGIGAIAVDPSRPNIVYASIGRSWHKVCGIVKSTDFGETWQFISDQACAYGEGGLSRKCGGPGILVDPNEEERLYVIDNLHDGGAGGVWISTDGGVHWQPSGLTKRRVFTLRFEPDRADVVYAGGINHESLKGGMFRSRDKGVTWEPIGLEGKSVFNFQFETGEPGIMYAACGLDGIFKTEDAGGTWRAINEGLPLAAEGAKGRFFSYHYAALDVDPQRAGHTITAARVIQAFYETFDGGKSWQKLRPTKIDSPDGWMLRPYHLGWHTNQIYFSPANPKTLYLCDFFGTWKSPDAGSTWTINPFGQESSCMVTVLPDGEINRRLYLGIWDHDVLIYTDDDVRPAADRVAGLIHGVPGTNAHVSGIAQDLYQPDRLLCVVNSTYLFQSTDRGRNWRQIKEGLPSDTMFRLGCPVMAPGAGLYLLPVNGDANDAGGVYASQDSGNSWRRLEGKGLGTLSITGQWNPVQNAFVSLTDGTVMALATGGTLYLSRDKGVSWTACKMPGAARVALDESDPNVVYVGCTGEQRGLYRGTDGGSTWTQISPQQGDVELLVVDRHDSNRLLCHLSEGRQDLQGRLDYFLMLSEDGGKTWQNLLNPSIAVWRLQGVAFDPFDKDRIYANTHWAGAWAAQRPKATTQPP